MVYSILYKWLLHWRGDSSGKTAPPKCSCSCKLCCGLVLHGYSVVSYSLWQSYPTLFNICVQLFATQWTVANQAPLSMGFSWQEYWSGLSFPLPGDLPTQGLNICLQCLLDWQVESLPLSPLAGRTAQSHRGWRVRGWRVRGWQEMAKCLMSA